MRMIMENENNTQGFTDIEAVEESLQKIYSGSLFENGFKNVDFKNVLN